MRILYVGGETGTSGLRRAALKRLGHEVDFLNPRDAFLRAKLSDQWLWKFGGTGLDFIVDLYLKAKLPRKTWDIAWIDAGEFIGRRSLENLARHVGATVCFNYDNPFVKRDGPRWRLLLQACSEYDLFVTPRDSSAQAAIDHGSARAFRCFQCADEIGDRPMEAAERDQSFSSEVMFAGYWFRDDRRCEFLLHLADRGLDIAIWGNKWQKSPNWRSLKRYWRGPSLVGRNYHVAIGSSKICIGLLSRGNEDVHTTRSVEIPFTGGLLCAEDTSDHRVMFRNWKDAVLWSDVGQCVDACIRLLAEPDLREEIRLSGMQRVRDLGLTNEALLSQIFDFLFSSGSPRIGRFTFRN